MSTKLRRSPRRAYATRMGPRSVVVLLGSLVSAGLIGLGLIGTSAAQAASTAPTSSAASSTPPATSIVPSSTAISSTPPATSIVPSSTAINAPTPPSSGFVNTATPSGFPVGNTGATHSSNRTPNWVVVSIGLVGLASTVLLALAFARRGEHS
jgi:hypothetical protein